MAALLIAAALVASMPQQKAALVVVSGLPATAGAHLAPVLDLPDGPLGSRQFRSPLFGVAFARGVAITDSLGVLGSKLAPLWAVEAVRAGADLVLFTSGRDAARATRALVPLARRGELDEHVARVLLFRAELG